MSLIDYTENIRRIYRIAFDISDRKYKIRNVYIFLGNVYPRNVMNILNKIQPGVKLTKQEMQILKGVFGKNWSQLLAYDTFPTITNKMQDRIIDELEEERKEAEEGRGVIAQISPDDTEIINGGQSGILLDETKTYHYLSDTIYPFNTLNRVKNRIYQRTGIPFFCQFLENIDRNKESSTQKIKHIDYKWFFSDMQSEQINISLLNIITEIENNLPFDRQFYDAYSNNLLSLRSNEFNIIGNIHDILLFSVYDIDLYHATGVIVNMNIQEINTTFKGYLVKYFPTFNSNSIQKFLTLCPKPGTFKGEYLTLFSERNQNIYKISNVELDAYNDYISQFISNLDTFAPSQQILLAFSYEEINFTKTHIFRSNEFFDNFICSDTFPSIKWFNERRTVFKIYKKYNTEIRLKYNSWITENIPGNITLLYRYNGVYIPVLLFETGRIFIRSVPCYMIELMTPKTFLKAFKKDIIEHVNGIRNKEIVFYRNQELNVGITNENIRNVNYQLFYNIEVPDFLRFDEFIKIFSLNLNSILFYSVQANLKRGRDDKKIYMRFLKSSTYNYENLMNVENNRTGRGHGTRLIIFVSNIVRVDILSASSMSEINLIHELISRIIRIFISFYFNVYGINRSIESQKEQRPRNKEAELRSSIRKSRLEYIRKKFEDIDERNLRPIVWKNEEFTRLLTRKTNFFKMSSESVAQGVKFIQRNDPTRFKYPLSSNIPSYSKIAQKPAQPILIDSGRADKLNQERILAVRNLTYPDRIDYYYCPNNRYKYPGFIKKVFTETGICSIECFKRKQLNISQKQEYFAKCMEDVLDTESFETEEQEEPEERESDTEHISDKPRYIVKEGKFIDKERFGFLPYSLNIIFNQNNPNITKFLALSNQLWILQGLENSKSFLSVIAHVFGIKLRTLQEQLIDYLDSNIEFFYTSDNGKLKEMFCEVDVFKRYIMMNVLDHIYLLDLILVVYGNKNVILLQYGNVGTEDSRKGSEPDTANIKVNIYYNINNVYKMNVDTNIIIYNSGYKQYTPMIFWNYGNIEYNIHNNHKEIFKKIYTTLESEEYEENITSTNYNKEIETLSNPNLGIVGIIENASNFITHIVIQKQRSTIILYLTIPIFHNDITKFVRNVESITIYKNESPKITFTDWNHLAKIMNILDIFPLYCIVLKNRIIQVIMSNRIPVDVNISLNNVPEKIFKSFVQNEQILQAPIDINAINRYISRNIIEEDSMTTMLSDYIYMQDIYNTFVFEFIESIHSERNTTIRNMLLERTGLGRYKLLIHLEESGQITPYDFNILKTAILTGFNERCLKQQFDFDKVTLGKLIKIIHDARENTYTSDSYYINLIKEIIKYLRKSNLINITTKENRLIRPKLSTIMQSNIYTKCLSLRRNKCELSNYCTFTPNSGCKITLTKKMFYQFVGRFARDLIINDEMYFKLKHNIVSSIKNPNIVSKEEHEIVF